MSALAFSLPHTLEADSPPEARGIDRDAVRLLVADDRHDRMIHARFHELPSLLDPGDLVVVNLSATLPAAVAGRRAGGEPVAVHVSTPAPGLGERWRVVELRSADGARPARGRAGETIVLGDTGGRAVETAPVPGAGSGDSESALELVAPYASGSRLLLARLHGPLSVSELLDRHGRPIRYGYVRHEWPLADYQNVYATTPGSAEMPSAGRPFTERLLDGLHARGVSVAAITLHTGVSSPERHEPPFPEPYAVPEATAEAIRAARAAGGRVIAVGTTVVRALETVSAADGIVAPGAGWTSLVITPDRPLRAVDGLITGWHEPGASHLQMLAALAAPDLLERCYRVALAHGYLWHEFGDSHLILR